MNQEQEIVVGSWWVNDKGDIAKVIKINETGGFSRLMIVAQRLNKAEEDFHLSGFLRSFKPLIGSRWRRLFNNMIVTITIPPSESNNRIEIAFDQEVSYSKAIRSFIGADSLSRHYSLIQDQSLDVEGENGVKTNQSDQ